ncbi:MAG: DNA polymerase III subunit beta [Parcubacteria group bacterium Greene0416_14]|nr:MAG: DNA polymerase III subunit beta [Parcubacteria group bacterium Greene0416_14]TSD01023.1 MAG: DNA polymerase III subunit beta [Parcubacteria group bacterium Greene1014_15]
MKIECVQEKLQSALSKTSRMTGKGNSYPILSCILLEAKNNTLFIRATNLDLGIEIILPAKVEKEGKVAVPGAILAQYIASLSSGRGVLLENIQDNLVITTISGKTTIKCISNEDFPVIPKIPKDISFKIPIEYLTRGLRSVWYSASISTIKPELASVYISVLNGMMYFVATDAFRLAEKRIQVANVPDYKPILVPVKNVGDILRVLEDTQGEVEVAFNENQIALYIESIYVTSRLTDGLFPDYNQIIPKTITTKAILLKNDLVNTLKTATIFSNKFNQSKILIDPEGKKIEIFTKNADVGENNESIPASVTGEIIEMMINYRFLLECFQSIYTDSVSLECSDVKKPIIIRGVGDTSFMYLIMPMNST